MKILIYALMFVFIVSTVSAACQINYYPSEDFDNMLSPKAKARMNSVCCDTDYERTTMVYPWMPTSSSQEADYPYMLTFRQKVRANAGCCEPNYDRTQADYPWYATHGKVKCLCTL